MLFPRCVVAQER